MKRLQTKAGYAQLQTLSGDEWQALQADFRKAVQAVETRELLVSTLADAATLEVFCQAQGVGIGRFAALVQLPASTVRHYVELGLVKPYLVNGKFKFVAPNLLELRGVRQWLELGLSLAEIKQRQGLQGLSPALLQSVTLEGKTIENAAVQVIRNERSTHQPPCQPWVRVLPQAEGEALMQTLGVDLRKYAQQTIVDAEAQIERLEQLQADTNARLKQAREFKDTMARAFRL